MERDRGRDRRRRGDRERGEGQRKGQGKKEIEGNVSIVIAEVPTTWEEIMFYSSQKVVPKIKINFYF